MPSSWQRCAFEVPTRSLRDRLRYSSEMPLRAFPCIPMSSDAFRCLSMLSSHLPSTRLPIAAHSPPTRLPLFGSVRFGSDRIGRRVRSYLPCSPTTSHALP